MGPNSFTLLTIDQVDDAFFRDWRERRDEHLALLAEKYVLHTRGPAGERARDWLRSAGVLPGDDISPAGPAKICALRVDGADLGESGMLFEDGPANRVADVATLAAAREDAERKRRVVPFAARIFL